MARPAMGIGRTEYDKASFVTALENPIAFPGDYVDGTTQAKKRVEDFDTTGAVSVEQIQAVADAGKNLGYRSPEEVRTTSSTGGQKGTKGSDKIETCQEKNPHHQQSATPSAPGSLPMGHAIDATPESDTEVTQNPASAQRQSQGRAGISGTRNSPQSRRESGSIEGAKDMPLTLSTGGNSNLHSLSGKSESPLTNMTGCLKNKEEAVGYAEECQAQIEGSPLTTRTSVGASGDSSAPAVTQGLASSEIRLTPSGEQQIISKSTTGGLKQVKPSRHDLIPSGALDALARHYGAGAIKYEDNQWRKGYEWGKSYAALQRHLNAWWGGEDLDEETGSSHMVAAAWHCFTLLTFIDEFPEFDDRFKKEEGE